ncbi:MAG: SIS domain-containing protein [Thermoanaerobacteraceae bacterium]|nr:SIS domain-containing protein [Thermoanaerobacteraceae bacterium]
MDITERAQYVLRTEAKSIEKVISSLDDNIEKAINLIYNCKGKLVITGLGKSGHIGKKLAATFSSTGTPSFFVHAAEALHGDLGMITKDDVVLAISNSGETKELLDMIPSLRIIGVKIISITGNRESSLAKTSDVHIEIKVDREADHLNLAPTSSSTAVLAVGDAMAVTLSEMKGFKEENFAVFHPGGSLGKRLLDKIRAEENA